ncbi:MAG TPA: VTT domain-containing protein [Bacillota bacterium]
MAIAVPFLLAVLIHLFLPDLPEKLTGSYRKIVQIYSSIDSFQEFTLGFGGWAPMVFLLAQLLQIIIAPLPGNIVAFAGGALFGVVKGFLLSAAGQISGSLLAFCLARKFGKPLVLKVIGSDLYEKYNTIFSGRFVLSLFLLFLLPFFPDDALCFLAGLSSLSLYLFLLLVVFGRLPGIVVATLAGAGVFHLSIWQWALICVLSLVCIYFIFKYRRLLEAWLLRKLGIDLEVKKE